jgi:hypothetical protein
MADTETQLRLKQVHDRLSQLYAQHGVATRDGITHDTCDEINELVREREQLLEKLNGTQTGT